MEGVDTRRMSIGTERKERRLLVRGKEIGVRIEKERESYRGGFLGCR